MSKVSQILQFWFGPPDSPSAERVQNWWFTSTPEIDRQMAELFAADCELAAAGYLDGWQEAAPSCLALLLLLDQMPRNLFRGQAKAYSTDAPALAIADRALGAKFDQELAIVERYFFYLPLQHSEVLADQDRSVALFQALPEHPEKARAMAAADLHRWLIEEFGRFPHRNAVLGRESTPSEVAYLQQPDAFHG
jgi:uncharacterized protein (DUF924 family)